MQTSNKINKNKSKYPILNKMPPFRFKFPAIRGSTNQRLATQFSPKMAYKTSPPPHFSDKTSKNFSTARSPRYKSPLPTTRVFTLVEARIQLTRRRSRRKNNNDANSKTAQLERQTRWFLRGGWGGGRNYLFFGSRVRRKNELELRDDVFSQRRGHRSPPHSKYKMAAAVGGNRKWPDGEPEFLNLGTRGLGIKTQNATSSWKCLFLYIFRVLYSKMSANRKNAGQRISEIPRFFGN